MPTPKRRSAVHAVQNLDRSPRVNGTGNPDAPLTEMQRQFVMYVVHDSMTQTAAARAAGFSGPGVAGMELMKHPKIIRAIGIEREKYAVASQVTKKRVIDGFLESIEMAKLKADPLTMIAGWREVGKMCGLYEATKTKVEISMNGRIMVEKMSAMSDEELLRIVEEKPELLETSGEGPNAVTDVDFREVPADDDAPTS